MFLWDALEPGLGLRVTKTGAKAFIFQSKLCGKTIRITIGDPRTWPLEAPRDREGKPLGKGARQEANRLQHQINEGRDPRLVRSDMLAAEESARIERIAAATALAAKRDRDAKTLGDAWPEYIADRSPLWSELHLRDHLQVIQPGGEVRKRSKKTTEAGPLASLANERLADLSTDRIEAWAKVESRSRPTRARLALRLLKAFLFWCRTHKQYREVVTENPARSKRARESLGKSKVKSDVLQREQLAAWFAAVRQLDSPVVRTYLQVLLLVGARREELATLRWDDVDLQWNQIRLSDKVEDFRMVPLTPFVADLLATLKRLNETRPNVRTLRRLAAADMAWEPSPWVFFSSAAASGRLMDPSDAHRRACQVAGLQLTLHGLRRSFATLSEWVEMPSGIAAQIQGHAPQGVREQNYIRRPLDLLRMWHIKIEAWILEQAGIDFAPAATGLRIIQEAKA